MEKKRCRFLAVDICYICMMALPILFGILLKIFLKPVSEGIQISGALIYCRIPMPLQDFFITEAQVNSWLVMISLFGLCLYLTHGLSTRKMLKRQIAVEWMVEAVEKLVVGNMGSFFAGFAPFVAAILGLSAFSSLLSLFGLYPPTSDLNVVAGWAILVFILITYYKSKCGPIVYMKSFANPALMAPLNIISEIATPISMAFRHYGNVLSGAVISVLVATGLQGLSHLILGWLPGFLGEIPLLRVGLPAILSIYFDLFSGCLQAYIFAMLTMMYVSGGFPMEIYLKKQKQKQSGGNKTC